MVKLDDGKGGPDPPAEVFDKFRVTFKEGVKMSMTGADGKTSESDYKLGPAAKPKAIVPLWYGTGVRDHKGRSSAATLSGPASRIG